MGKRNKIAMMAMSLALSFGSQAQAWQIEKVNTAAPVVIDGKVALPQGASVMELVVSGDPIYLELELAQSGLYTLKASQGGWQLLDEHGQPQLLSQYNWAEWQSMHYVPMGGW